MTCSVSTAAILAGISVLLVALPAGTPARAMVVLFGVALLVLEWHLWRAASPLDEVITIGIAARVGNGLLLTLLSLSLLMAAGADGPSIIAMCACGTALYGFLLVSFLGHPETYRFGNDIVHESIRRRGGMMPTRELRTVEDRCDQNRRASSRA